MPENMSEEMKVLLGPTERPGGVVKQAYAFDDDDEGERLYPIGDRESIEKSARHFHRHRASYPFEWRRQIAGNMLKAAEKIDFRPPHARYLEQAAGRGTANMQKLAKKLKLRAEHAPEQMRDGVRKLADELAASEPDPKLAGACAELMAQIDEESGAYRRYAEGRTMPEELAFTHTQSDIKKATERMVKLPNGHVVTRSQLEAAPLSKVATVIGGDLEKWAVDNLHRSNLTRDLPTRLNAAQADTLQSMLPPPCEGELPPAL